MQPEWWQGAPWLEQDAELERFGMNLFKHEVSTFAPIDNAPVPATYRLGGGDTIVIQLFGKVNARYALEIDREGQISFPELGVLNLAGLTFDTATQLISKNVKERLIGVDVAVSMGRLRVISIFLSGEVAVPGSYNVSALTTVTQALFQAGGVSEIGSLREILVKRDGQTYATFDTYDLLMRGDASGDVRLQAGDVIFVPPYKAVVDIDGEVKRPRVYELKGDETLGDVLDMAGGLTRDAFARSATIRRLAADGGLPKVLNVALNNNAHLISPIMDGDVIEVRARGEALQNSVKLSGAVYRPGVYGWDTDLRITDLVNDIERDLLKNVDMRIAIIVRIANDLQDIKVIQFSLAEALAAPKSESDPLLQPRDEVLVFNLPGVLLDENGEMLMAMEDGAQEESAQQMLDGLLSAEGANRFLLDNPNFGLNTPLGAVGGSRTQLPTQTQLDPRNSTTLMSQPNQQGSLMPNMNFDTLAYLRWQQDQSALAKEQEASLNDSGDRAKLLTPVISKLRLQARQNEPEQVVSISGAVRAPGDYPLVQGATLADLIEIAGGLKDNAFLEAAELRRLRQDADGKISVSYAAVDLAAVLDESGNRSLMSRDHLTVRAIPDWSPTDSIKISGEVRFPGTYRLQKGETLADVIKRAGGLTEEAFPEGAMLTRESVAERETERAKELADSIRQSIATSLLTEETQKVALSEIDVITRQLASFKGKGRLLIDLPSALAGDRLANIQVLDGDAIDIPQNLSNITVVGEVKRQGTHSFQKSLSVEDYIGLSAGYTPRADSEGIYIVRANGSVQTIEQSWWFFSKGSMDLRPGDTVVVPVNQRYKESLSNWRDITQIIYQGAVSIAAVMAL
jgi:protein involved in polysaccharide export with SLBB domain